MASYTKQQWQPPEPLISLEEELERMILEFETRGEIIDLAGDDDGERGEIIDVAGDDDDDDGGQERRRGRDDEKNPKRPQQGSVCPNRKSGCGAASTCANQESSKGGMNNDADSVTAARSTLSLDVGKAVEVLQNGEWLEASVKQMVSKGFVFQLHTGPTVMVPTGYLSTDVRRGNHGCFVCSLVKDEESVLLCDGLRGDGSACNREAHYWCVGLTEVPTLDWFCRECDGHGAQYAAGLAKSLAVAKEKLAVMAASTALAEQKRAREATEKQPFPSHWTFCKAGDDIVGNDRHLIDVESCSYEWRLIEERLRQSLPEASVVSAQRLESSLLFSEYTHRAGVISAKQKRLGKTEDPKEVFLWHGTKYPLSVARHEHGLDPRFGKVGGFYGTGAYYAKKARYCHGNIGTRQYVRSNSDGSFTILLSKVLLGSTVSFGQKIDRTLTMPPPLGGNGTLYDSVSGGPHKPHQKGPGPNDSTIFVVYEASQAMLANIVTYKLPAKPPLCALPAPAKAASHSSSGAAAMPIHGTAALPCTSKVATSQISASQQPAISVNKAAAPAKAASFSSPVSSSITSQFTQSLSLRSVIFLTIVCSFLFLYVRLHLYCEIEWNLP